MCGSSNSTSPSRTSEPHQGIHAPLPVNPTLPGLFACGELVGGSFYLSYPGDAGLTNGAVFGRMAGSQAREFVAESARRQ
jgi:succinate dehydrogenase/fumarate reductase flavoprotein subunit